MNAQAPYRTPADAAELKVLVYELALGQGHHRANCRACQPCPTYAAWKQHKAGCLACLAEAALTPPCPEHARFVEHGADCLPCNPCRGMQKAVAVVVDWHERRTLVSKATWLRRLENESEAA